jgi:hypothetical protein
MLEQIFGDGVTELAELVARLNATGLRDPDGEAWTQQSFAAHMQRLGA